MALAHEQAAETEEHELRLAANDVPKEAGGFVAVNFGQRCADAGVQEVDQLRIVFLLKMMHGAADEPVGGEFAAQYAQFNAAARVQNGLGDAQGAAKPGHDAAYGGDFDLGSGVAY